jgi:hypothetical protein
MPLNLASLPRRDPISEDGDKSPIAAAMRIWIPVFLKRSKHVRGNNMSAPLFRQGIYAYQREQQNAAIAKIQSIADQDLLNPNLAGKLDKLADHAVFEVANLDIARQWGKPRKEQHERERGGQTYVFDVEMMDMHIPFAGDPRSFLLQPSSSQMIDTRADVSGNELLVTFPYDDDLQRQMGFFVDKVVTNLDQLRKELPSIRAEVRNTIDQVANERVAAARAQHGRDQTLSFPVRRD